MKCLNCGFENKGLTKLCKKCGSDLTLPPAWFPNWKWHLKTLSWIYISLIIAFFVISFILHKLPPPYDQRDISPEMTPWLNHKPAVNTDSMQISNTDGKKEISEKKNDKK